MLVIESLEYFAFTFKIKELAALNQLQLDLILVKEKYSYF